MATLSKSRVLVTGADGFIGSHLVEQLVAAGAQVRALSQYNSFNDWGWLEQVSCLKQIEVITGDVRDPHLCDELTRGIDVVFHLAALIPIPYSYRAPDSFVDTNVKGTLNLCQAARQEQTSSDFFRPPPARFMVRHNMCPSTKNILFSRSPRIAPPRSQPTA